MKIFSTLVLIPRGGDVASATIHDIGARYAIENSHQTEARMVRVPLVLTILARDMRSKIFSTILGQNGASAASHDIGTRYAIDLQQHVVPI